VCIRSLDIHSGSESSSGAPRVSDAAIGLSSSWGLALYPFLFWVAVADCFQGERLYNLKSKCNGEVIAPMQGLQRGVIRESCPKPTQVLNRQILCQTGILEFTTFPQYPQEIGSKCPYTQQIRKSTDVQVSNIRWPSIDFKSPRFPVIPYIM
jgi:hypothetical protein